MIENMVKGLGEAFGYAVSGGVLDFLKGIKYGAPQAIATNEMPCLLYNILDFSVSPNFEVCAKFGIYVCAAITATKEEASLEAQKLAWNYSENPPYDRGILPFLAKIAKTRF